MKKLIEGSSTVRFKVDDRRIHMNELNADKFGCCFAGKWGLVYLVLAVAIGFAATASVVRAKTEKPASVAAGRQLSKGKQTTLGLYVTAAQAYKKLEAAPDKVKLIDVRTPEEYAFIGHPEMAWNIPLAFVTYQRKDGKTEYGPKMNPDFVAEVKKLSEPTDTVLLMCRSGDRPG